MARMRVPTRGTKQWQSHRAGLLLALVMIRVAPACHEVPAKAASPAVPPEPVQEAPARRALAITHVTLIDPLSGARPDITIVIDGEQISEVGPSSSIAIPAGAAVYDGLGRFAVPGFWDAHVHVSQIGVDSIRLMVANGVTSVRDMGSAFADITRWRSIRTAGGLAPRVFSSGPMIDGRGEEGYDNWVVSTPADARLAVYRLKQIGVDFIKVHGGLSRPVYEALAAESRREGLFFAGHTGAGYPPLLAAAAGQRTIEHGRGMVPCSPQERARLRADSSLSRLASICAPESVAAQILPAMARANVWFTPTLVSWRGHRLTPNDVARLNGASYLTPTLKAKWGEPEPPPGPMELELLSELGPLTASADRAGVHLLTGSDAGDPYVIPGFAVHDEMQLFVEAGVPPLVALRSATLEAARALGVDDKIGSIERGKAADVVLLAADPLADIRNTRRVVTVIVNGRRFDEEHLAALLGALRGPG